MSLQVTFDLPTEVEEKLRRESPDLDADVKETYALELFRRGKLTHCKLSSVLGLDRFATDAYLKQHNVVEGSLTMADLEADRQTLDRVLAVVGTATLGGTLDVELYGGFTPHEDDTFTFLTATSIAGDFATFIVAAEQTSSACD